MRQKKMIIAALAAILLAIPAMVQSKKGEAAKKAAIEREQSQARLNPAEREQARPKVKAAIERALNELARFFEREQARQDVKAAIERALNELARFFECEQARPKVNTHSLICLMVACNMLEIQCNDVWIRLACQTELAVSLISFQAVAPQLHHVVVAVAVGVGESNDRSASQFQVAGIGVGEVERTTHHAGDAVALNIDAVTCGQQIAIQVETVTVFLQRVIVSP